MTRKSRREIENTLESLDDAEDEDVQTVVVVDWMDDHPGPEDVDADEEIVIDFTDVDT